ncbi:MAG: Lhr family helicase, partial [Nitrospiraceae bacterium]
QIQRMRAEDLLAAVFPAALACQDNHRADPGDREVPDHPLVQETIRDCLTEAMDLDALTALLRRIERGAVRCLAVDTPAPSPFCHEILNANPYAYLDDAPLEERRARAVQMRRSLPPELAGDVGALSPEAIAEVTEEAWPVIRDPDELHDALLTLIWVPEEEGQGWAVHLPALIEAGRATVMTVPLTPALSPEGRGNSLRALSRGANCSSGCNGPWRGEGEGEFSKGWVAAERLAIARMAFPDATMRPDRSEIVTDSLPDRDTAILQVVQGWMESIGPTTAAELAARLHLPVQDVSAALLKLEAQGQVLRGSFRPAQQVRGSGFEVRGEGNNSLHASRFTNDEFCDRRLLARIHRLTIGRLRKEIEPVTAADFMRFLFQWQHVAPGSRLHGEPGLLEVIRQLAGFEAAASAWERHLLPLRLSKYDPETLDRLCLNGAAMWGRLSPHPRLEPQPDSAPDSPRMRRIVPTSVAPIGVFPREDAEWLLNAFGDEAGPGRVDLMPALSSVAQDLHRHLQTRGASFFADLGRGTGHLPSEVEDGLWELVAAGLVTADGFDNLRALLDPRRRRAEGRARTRRPRHGAGRWSLLRPAISHKPLAISSGEPMARQLLRRYGVVFRDLLGRESLSLAWRDLLVQYRRMELRGEVRGGRFVSGFTGEQFALPEAVESLRAMRKAAAVGASPEIRISAADPLNLVGIILPGPRVPAVPSNYLIFRDGLAMRSGTMREPGIVRALPDQVTQDKMIR